MSGKGGTNGETSRTRRFIHDVFRSVRGHLCFGGTTGQDTPRAMMKVDDIFQDRRHAGRELAKRLIPYAQQENVLALALPRGGVPVAYEVATALHVPLDVFIVRKLGVPGHEELAMGAIASGGVRVLNDEIVNQIPQVGDIISAVAAREMQELERREFLYRGRRPPADVLGKTVLVIDDGLATGSTMRAAVLALRQQEAGKIVVAVPVASRETCLQLANQADEVVCVEIPSNFMAVGQFYADFSQTSDAEVSDLLAQAAQQLNARNDS
jgi:putative phosphoribosyl transferase